MKKQNYVTKTRRTVSLKIYYSFTPPRATPSMMKRDRKTYAIISGIIESAITAACAPLSRKLSLVTTAVTISGIVRFSQERSVESERIICGV